MMGLPRELGGSEVLPLACGKLAGTPQGKLRVTSPNAQPTWVTGQRPACGSEDEPKPFTSIPG